MSKIKPYSNCYVDDENHNKNMPSGYYIKKILIKSLRFY